MRPETLYSVVTEAQCRWAKRFPFDLNPDEWERLALTFHCGDLLQAITIVSRTQATDPQRIHESLLHHLERLDENRQLRKAFLT